MDFIKGEESMLYIKRPSDLVFIPVACLTSSPMSEEVDMIATTTRDNEGWETARPTLQRYSLEVNGIMTKDDEDSGNDVISYNELRRIKRNRVLIEWQLKTLGGYYIDSGKAHITSISKTDEVNNDISFSASLVGFGAPLESRFPKILGDTDDILTDNKNNAIWITT